MIKFEPSLEPISQKPNCPDFEQMSWLQRLWRGEIDKYVCKKADKCKNNQGTVAGGLQAGNGCCNGYFEELDPMMEEVDGLPGLYRRRND